MRTVAEDVRDDALLADIAYLRKLWGRDFHRAQTAGPASLLHEDPDLG